MAHQRLPQKILAALYIHLKMFPFSDVLSGFGRSVSHQEHDS